MPRDASRARGGSTVVAYTLAALQPSLASRASASAVQGVAGLRGLNDGIVPVTAAAAGRGRRDGLRVRFHVIRRDQRLHMESDHDGFAKEQPIVVSDDLSRIEFTVENRTGGAHTTGLSLSGVPGPYRVTIDGREVGAAGALVNLPISAAATARVRIERR